MEQLNCTIHEDICKHFTCFKAIIFLMSQFNHLDTFAKVFREIKPEFYL